MEGPDDFSIMLETQNHFQYISINNNYAVNHSEHLGFVTGNDTIPYKNDIYYFEIKVENKEAGDLSIGFIPRSSFNGKEETEKNNGYTFRNDNKVFTPDKISGVDWIQGETWGEVGDIIGCGVFFDSMELFYTKNRKYLSKSSKINREHVTELLPFIVIGPNRQISANFGGSEYSFDVNHLRAKIEKDREKQIRMISIPRDLTLSIVRDYLLYHAYDSTLHALDSVTRPSPSFPASGIMPISSAYESESVHQFDQDGSNMSLCEDNPASMSVCLSDNLLTQESLEGTAQATSYCKEQEMNLSVCRQGEYGLKGTLSDSAPTKYASAPITQADLSSSLTKLIGGFKRASALARFAYPNQEGTMSLSKNEILQTNRRKDSLNNLKDATAELVNKSKSDDGDEGKFDYCSNKMDISDNGEDEDEDDDVRAMSDEDSRSVDSCDLQELEDLYSFRRAATMRRTDLDQRSSHQAKRHKRPSKLSLDRNIVLSKLTMNGTGQVHHMGLPNSDCGIATSREIYCWGSLELRSQLRHLILEGKINDAIKIILNCEHQLSVTPKKGINNSSGDRKWIRSCADIQSKVVGSHHMDLEVQTGSRFYHSPAYVYLKCLEFVETLRQGDPMRAINIAKESFSFIAHRTYQQQQQVLGTSSSPLTQTNTSTCKEKGDYMHLSSNMNDNDMRNTPIFDGVYKDKDYDVSARSDESIDKGKIEMNPRPPSWNASPDFKKRKPNSSPLTVNGKAVPISAVNASSKWSESNDGHAVLGVDCDEGTYCVLQRLVQDTLFLLVSYNVPNSDEGCSQGCNSAATKFTSQDQVLMSGEFLTMVADIVNSYMMFNYSRSHLSTLELCFSHLIHMSDFDGNTVECCDGSISSDKLGSSNSRGKYSKHGIIDTNLSNSKLAPYSILGISWPLI